MVVIPLTHPMLWNNSLPILFMATDKVADPTNTALHCNQTSHNQKLDDHAEALVISDYPPLQSYLAGLIRNPYLSCTNAKPTAYMDVFIDNFLGIA